MIEVNWVLIIVATIAQFVLGALWYSPMLFGKVWMQIMEVTHLSKEAMQKMQKEMAPFYGLQILLTLFTTFNLANFIGMLPQFSSYHLAFWIWSAFIVPTQISAVIWANTKKKYWLKQLGIMISMQLVGIMLAAWILSM
jgi:hypothetical protein